MRTFNAIVFGAALFSLSACDSNKSSESSTPADAQADAAPANEAAAATPPAQPASATPPVDAELPNQNEAPVGDYPAATADATAQNGKPCPDGKKAGDKWKVDCNECFCSEEGVVACTLAACVDLPQE